MTKVDEFVVSRVHPITEDGFGSALWFAYSKVQLFALNNGYRIVSKPAAKIVKHPFDDQLTCVDVSVRVMKVRLPSR